MKLIKTYEGFFDRFKKKPPKPFQYQGDYWFISSNEPTYMKLAFIKISEIISKEYTPIMTEPAILNSIEKLEGLYQILANDHVNTSRIPWSSTSFYLALDYNSQRWTYSAGSYPFVRLYKFKGEVKVDDFEIDAEKYNL